MKNYRKIGQGSFSNVFRKGNSKEVLIISNDPVKECMSFGWFPKTRLFPTIARVDYGEATSTYKMKYYEKVTAPKKQLNARAYELYKELRALHPIFTLTRTKRPTCFYWIDEFKKLKNKNVRQILIEAVESLMNYGDDVCFEISPRNIATTKTGNLILLDCFFLHSQLQLKRG